MYAINITKHIRETSTTMWRCRCTGGGGEREGENSEESICVTYIDYSIGREEKALLP
jgi:hypothetical protein